MGTFRLGEKDLKRRGRFRSPNRIVLIITNGEKTEPIYFKNFKKSDSSIKIEIRKESGTDPITLIKFAMRIRDDYDADRIYCVFDVDSSSDEQLTEAKNMANKNGMNTCISNPCFEVWYLLHFENCNSVFNSYNDLERKLLNHIPDYKKNLNVYGKLQPLQKEAIANAKRLTEHHGSEGNLSIRRCNPSTQVFELVEYLMS